MNSTEQNGKEALVFCNAFLELMMHQEQDWQRSAEQDGFDHGCSRFSKLKLARGEGRTGIDRANVVSAQQHLGLRSELGCTKPMWRESLCKPGILFLFVHLPLLKEFVEVASFYASLFGSTCRL